MDQVLILVPYTSKLFIATHDDYYDYYRQLRHTAYRQLVTWCWGWLGRHNRVVLPACAVKKIRDTFPSDGNYVGFEM